MRDDGKTTFAAPGNGSGVTARSPERKRTAGTLGVQMQNDPGAAAAAAGFALSGKASQNKIIMEENAVGITYE